MSDLSVPPYITPEPSLEKALNTAMVVSHPRHSTSPSTIAAPSPPQPFEALPAPPPAQEIPLTPSALPVGNVIDMLFPWLKGLLSKVFVSANNTSEALPYP